MDKQNSNGTIIKILILIISLMFTILNGLNFWLINRTFTKIDNIESSITIQFKNHSDIDNLKNTEIYNKLFDHEKRIIKLEK